MEKKFQYKGSDVYYQVFGNGQPVLLLHGFGENSNIWRDQIAYLQEDCQLIVPDLPGTGKSEMLQMERPDIEGYAECLKALTDSENIRSFIMLGHSLGGYITLAFAEKNCRLLKGWGLVHSTAFADNEDKKLTRKKAIAFIEEHGAYPFIKNTTPNLFSENFKKLHPEKVAALIEEGKTFSKEALIQYYTAMINRPDRTSVLQSSPTPVLFIIGTEDIAAPMADLLHQVHLPKVSHVHIIEGVGHMSMMEEPEVLNKQLLDFIRSIK